MNTSTALPSFLVFLLIATLSRPSQANPTTPESSEDPRHLQRVVYWQNRIKLLKLKREEHQILAQLESLDQQSVSLHEQIVQTRRQVEQLKKQVALAHQDWQLQDQIAKRVLLQIRPRLQVLYRMARLGKAQLLMGAHSLYAISQRWRVIHMLSTKDLQMLQNYQLIRKQAAQREQFWHNQQKTMLAAVTQLNKKRQHLYRQRMEKASLLQALYRDMETYRNVLRSLQGKGQHIQYMISHTETQKTTGGLALHRGQLPWPIQGFSPHCEAYILKQSGSFQQLHCQKSNLLPRSMKCPLGRNGIVMYIPEGTAILSVAKGTVAAVGFQRGYGQLVILDHGYRFYSIYAHLSRLLVQKGEEVNAQAPLGLSGSTGTLGSPLLYFELRQGIKPMSPELWLSPTQP